jgi:hypothetical protein
MKTVNAEVGITLLIGFLLTVAGVYLNFQNLGWSTEKNIDYGQLVSNEIIYGLIQIIGMAIIFVGLTRSLMHRSDVMSNKFVNIMDVFTSLIKKEMEVIDDHERKKHIAELEERSERFKNELKDLKRI